MNNYFINPTRGVYWGDPGDSSCYLVPPNSEGFKRWIKDSKVCKKDVDSLTLDARNYGVDQILTHFLDNLRVASVHIRNLKF